MTLGGEACHPELVEGSRAEALPTMLRQAQHDTRFKHVMGRHEGSSSPCIAAMQVVEDASFLSMTNELMSFHLQMSQFELECDNRKFKRLRLNYSGLERPRSRFTVSVDAHFPDSSSVDAQTCENYFIYQPH